MVLNSKTWGHSSLVSEVLSLRRLPACEWRAQERNALRLREEGGGAPLLQYRSDPIEGAPGPTPDVTGSVIK
ncbi:hypothetical protein PBY51_013464 [Eleginops maclovinus]|uniref:Uncharacterized protein n=1 Tax=Eleginops maclovinus TaxID=56733 RepID=A0AAN8ART8_ELEMC|nr:hypothetical protein PBY51_013464 [Eleginops maclovinus]